MLTPTRGSPVSRSANLAVASNSSLNLTAPADSASGRAITSLRLPIPAEVAASKFKHRVLGATAVGVGALAIIGGAVGAFLLGAGYATGVFDPALMGVSLTVFTTGIGSIYLGLRVRTCKDCLPSMPEIMDHLDHALTTQNEAVFTTPAASVFTAPPSDGCRTRVMSGLGWLRDSIEPSDRDARRRALEIIHTTLRAYAHDSDVVDAALGVLFAIGDHADTFAFISPCRGILLGHTLRILADENTAADFVRSACNMLPRLCAEEPHNDDEQALYDDVHAQICEVMERLCQNDARMMKRFDSASADIMLAFLKTCSVLQTHGIANRHIIFNTLHALECYPDPAMLEIGMLMMQCAVASAQRGSDARGISEFIQRFLPGMMQDATLREVAYNLWKSLGEQTSAGQAAQEYAWNELLTAAKA